MRFLSSFLSGILRPLVGYEERDSFCIRLLGGRVIAVAKDEPLFLRVAVRNDMERNSIGESVTLGGVIGECKIGEKACSVKMQESQGHVIIVMTEKGSDLPIPGTQIKIMKGSLDVSFEDRKGLNFDRF